MTHQDQQKDPILSDAVSWYWRLQDPEISIEERREFRAWIVVNRHREAFDRAANVWEDIRLAMHVGGAASAAPPSTHLRVKKVLARAAIGVFMFLAFGPPPGTPTSIREAGDTTTAFPLIDGSFARLAHHTRLEISFDERERSSYLPHGRAYFHVAADSKRPFIVRTPDVVVRATGTRFAVSYQQRTSIITVTEGSVMVTRPSSPAPGASQAPASGWSVPAGHRLQISGRAANGVTSAEADVSLDWATTITFEREPPGVAVEHFNRLSTARVELVNPNVAGNLVTGTYQLDDPIAFAAKLANETSSPVRLYQRAASGRARTPAVVRPGDTHELGPKPNRHPNLETVP